MSGNELEEHREQKLLEEIERLRQEVERLQSENNDLQIVLLTTVEHGAFIEAQLEETNQQLQEEINERKRSEKALKAILEIESQQKDDLEILTQIIVEHSDIIDLQWQDKVKQADRLASVDPLTQLANRRGFDRYLEQQWQKMREEQAPLSLLICDIDYFKQYNDSYGHLAGDECLQKIARVLERESKPFKGLIARYGGEEFAAVFPRINVSEAVAIAELLRSEVRNLKLPHARSSGSQYVTLSVGLASRIPTPQISASLLLEQADRLLYQAKQQGRNQVVYKTLESE